MLCITVIIILNVLYIGKIVKKFLNLEFVRAILNFIGESLLFH